MPRRVGVYPASRRISELLAHLQIDPPSDGLDTGAAVGINTRDSRTPGELDLRRRRGGGPREREKPKW